MGDCIAVGEGSTVHALAVGVDGSGVLNGAEAVTAAEGTAPGVPQAFNVRKLMAAAYSHLEVAFPITE